MPTVLLSQGMRPCQSYPMGGYEVDQSTRDAVQAAQLISQIQGAGERIRAAASIDAQDKAWVADVVPQELPYPWTIESRAPGDPGAYAARSLGGLYVMVSGRTEQDGRRWLHVSYSRRDKIPDYRDTTLVKETFIGKDRYAYAVYPTAKDHVNIARYCLHLWCCIDAPDGMALPDFTWGTGVI
jgi:hypothetical protein